MIISRRVNSEGGREGPTLWRTIGIYGHLPVIKKCDYDKPYKVADMEDEEYLWILERFYDKHKSCTSRTRHLYLRGFLRLVGPNKIRTFWYMGNPYRHKILTAHDSSLVVFRGKVIRGSRITQT